MKTFAFTPLHPFPPNIGSLFPTCLGSKLVVAAPHLLRTYPVGMARRLEELYQRAKGETICDLRKKFTLDLNLTDRELFEAYPMTDLFLDGKLHECFFYMYNHCDLQVPDSWDGTMAQFHKDLKTADSHLKRSFELLIIMFTGFFLFMLLISLHHLRNKWRNPQTKTRPKEYTTYLMEILW